MGEYDHLVFEIIYLYGVERFFYRLIKPGGEIVLNSEAYDTKFKVISIAEQVIIDGQRHGNGNYNDRGRSFLLNDEHDNLLGESPNFHNEEKCSQEIEYLKDNLQNATILM